MNSEEQKKAVGKYLMYFILIGIGIVHIYKINSIPVGVNIDEMGMGYDAYCLANYGVDRYLESFPAYLTNYGGGQSVLYAYLCAILVKIGGLSIYTMRLPGIILMLISVWCGMRTMQIMTKDSCWQSVIYGVGALTMPVYIMLFRIGMDCNLMLALAAIVILYVAKCIEENRNIDFLGLGISSGVLLYTYALSYPVLLLFTGMLFLYLVIMRKINFKQILCWFVPLAILAMPLILVQIVNIFDLPEIKLGSITITKLMVYRKSEISLANINVQSVIRCCKVIFGYDWLRYNSLPEFGTVYYISIPFIIIGFVYSISIVIKSCRLHKAVTEMAYIIWFIILFFIGCCLEANVNRLNAIYVPVLFFWTQGVKWIVGICRSKKAQHIVEGCIIIVYLILFGLFCVFYFGKEYREKYEPLEFFGYLYGEDVLEYAINLNDKAPIYVDDSYIYYLGTVEESPYMLELDSIYQRFHFDYDGDVDYFGEYIVKDTDEVMKNNLLERGFLEKNFEHYNVYIYPMEQEWKELNPSEYTWNSGIEEDNILNLTQATQNIEGMEYIVIVGWSYDSESDKVWDKVYLQIGTQYYTADVTEREDVVELMQNTDLLQSGILFVIPKDKFMENTVQLKCIGNGNLRELSIRVEQ